MENFCRKCGNELTSDSVFCNKCGTQTLESMTPVAPIPGRTNCKLSFIFGIVGLAATAAILICLIAFSFNWDNFFMGVVIAWITICVVLNLISFFFGNSAQKAGNSSEMLKRARTLHSLGLIGNSIQIIMFIILAACA